MTPPELDRLHAVLDEWQARVEPKPGFEARLHDHAARRVRRNHGHAWIGAAAAAVVLAAFVYFGQLNPSPSAQTAEQVAVMQDLQLWNKNADLIEHLDFLSLSAHTPANQERD